MGWNAYRTPRNTLHVISSDDGSHFEATDEEEAQTNIAAITEAREAAARAKEEAERATNELNMPVGNEPTLRVN
jgi:hypothetical protein